MDIETLTSEQAAALVGQEVTVRTAEGALALRLDKVDAQDPGSTPEGAVRQGFAMVLSGPASPFFEQGVWAVTLPGLPETPLFLSPFYQDDSVTRYEIVLN